MNDERKPKPDDDDESGRDAIVAADDTGMVTNEIQIVEADIAEGESLREALKPPL